MVPARKLMSHPIHWIRAPSSDFLQLIGIWVIWQKMDNRVPINGMILEAMKNMKSSTYNMPQWLNQINLWNVLRSHPPSLDHQDALNVASKGVTKWKYNSPSKLNPTRPRSSGCNTMRLSPLLISSEKPESSCEEPLNGKDLISSLAEGRVLFFWDYATTV